MQVIFIVGFSTTWNSTKLQAKDKVNQIVKLQVFWKNLTYLWQVSLYPFRSLDRYKHKNKCTMKRNKWLIWFRVKAQLRKEDETKQEGGSALSRLIYLKS